MKHYPTIALVVFWVLALFLFIETKAPAARALLPIAALLTVFYAVFLTIVHFVEKINSNNNEQEQNKQKKNK